MNALDAGLLCTLLLIGTVAALLGGMSAARYPRYVPQAREFEQRRKHRYD